MFEEDHAPVVLSNIYHQAASCQKTIKLTQDRSHVRSVQSLSNYTDTSFTGCGPSHDLTICTSFALSETLQRPVPPMAFSELAQAAYWRAAARDFTPDAPSHLARHILLND